VFTTYRLIDQLQYTNPEGKASELWSQSIDAWRAVPDKVCQGLSCNDLFQRLEVRALTIKEVIRTLRKRATARV